MFMGIKNMRKLHIKPDGVVYEPLKGIAYSKPLPVDGVEVDHEAVEVKNKKVEAGDSLNQEN
jgi:hypothetical protein